MISVANDLLNNSLALCYGTDGRPHSYMDVFADTYAQMHIFVVSICITFTVNIGGHTLPLPRLSRPLWHLWCTLSAPPLLLDNHRLVCSLSGQTEKLAETLISCLPGRRYWFQSFLSVLLCVTLDIFSTCFYLKTHHVTRVLIQLCYSHKCRIVLHLTLKSTINRSALNQPRMLKPQICLLQRELGPTACVCVPDPRIPLILGPCRNVCILLLLCFCI